MLQYEAQTAILYLMISMSPKRKIRQNVGVRDEACYRLLTVLIACQSLK